MAVITKSIGTSGRDYSTIALWDASVPADVVASGNSYVGELYNDSEFAGYALTSHVTDSSHTITLTAAAGQSFQDQAGVRTNPLKYDVTKGVGIFSSSGYSYGLASAIDYITVSRIQVKTTAGSAFTFGVGPSTGSAATAICKDIIIEASPNGFASTNVAAVTGQAYNLVIINNGANGNGLELGGLSIATGCTVVRLSDQGAAGIGIKAINYSNPIVTSCAVFGYATCADVAGSGVFDSGSKNNATEQTSGLPGSSNHHLVTYTHSTPFYEASGTGTDFRAIASTTLASNGFKDATNAPSDISGTARASSPTVGAWEIAGGGGGGGSNHNALLLLGIG